MPTQAGIAPGDYSTVVGNTGLNQFGQLPAPAPKPSTFDTQAVMDAQTARNQQAATFAQSLQSGQNKLSAQDQALKLQSQLASSLAGITSAGSATSPTAGGGGGATASFGAAPTGPATSGIAPVGSGGGASIGSMAPPNIAPSQNAAFARAKDIAGNLGRSSVSSLNDTMAGRGALNSGITNNGLVDRLAATTNALGGVNNAQLGDAYAAASHQQDLGNADQIAQFQGGVTERGQDVQAFTAQTALAQQKQLALTNLLSSAFGSAF